MTVNEPFVTGLADAGDAGGKAVQDGFVNLPDGSVLVGVQPPAHPTSVSTTEGVVTPPAPQKPEGRTFSEEDVARIRKEEKDKLYSDLEETKRSLKEMEKRDRERAKAEKEAQEAAAAEANRKAEEEMEFKTLLDKRTEEFNQRLAAEQQEREKLVATLDMERRYAEVTSYKAQRIDQERDNILPELINLIAGNTPEEIESSIESLRNTTASILGNIQQAQQVARQQMTGASVTAPPVGPMETQATTQQLSPDDIRNMPIEQYAQHRDRLLGAVRQTAKTNGIYER